MPRTRRGSRRTTRAHALATAAAPVSVRPRGRGRRGRRSVDTPSAGAQTTDAQTQAVAERDQQLIPQSLDELLALVRSEVQRAGGQRDQGGESTQDGTSSGSGAGVTVQEQVLASTTHTQATQGAQG
jgi:hypothetical protein